MQMNKRFGLKKLRKIAGRDERWFVSPFTVFQNVKQMRLKGPTQRVLIRTDEKGRNYSKLRHEDMPRTEINFRHTWLPKKVKEVITRATTRFAIFKRQVQNLDEEKRTSLPRKKMVVITHPTRPREDMAYTGTINIFGGVDWITLFKSPSPKEHVHRYLQTVGEKIWLQKKDDKYYIHPDSLSGRKEHETSLLLNAVDFLNKGINEKQIKPKRTIEISFVTWKDAPSNLELFDLIETRKTPLRAKKQ